MSGCHRALNSAEEMAFMTVDPEFISDLMASFSGSCRVLPQQEDLRDCVRVDFDVLSSNCPCRNSPLLLRNVTGGYEFLKGLKVEYICCKSAECINNSKALGEPRRPPRLSNRFLNSKEEQ